MQQVRAGSLDVNERHLTDMTRGETALVYAAKGGNAAIVKLLLQAGADWSLTDDKGRSPLHWAVHNKHAEAAFELLNSGARDDSDSLPDPVRGRLTREMAQDWAASEEPAAAAAGLQVVALLEASPSVHDA